MSKKTNIVLVGVGGQGVITAANILGKAAVNANVNVFVSEVHGMAQRGGSVNCTARMGDVSGPLIASGTADAIVSTEPIEALRYIHYSNKDTKIITDVTPVIPFTVSTGDEEYPETGKIFKELEKYGKLHKIDATRLAKDAGAIITKNVVMLGALTGANVLPFKSDVLLDTILENVPEKYQNINKKAFELGFKSIKS
ncbi:MAG: indolepyruvate ferredoxin oxidoreductase subunit beta [Candidatus Thermoplasmatota archaeon]|nr:indolepyruvate ferredoxin oxidoreductase subunit beta [Candidatus Thermoplasmatota archaeon]